MHEKRLPCSSSAPALQLVDLGRFTMVSIRNPGHERMPPGKP
jgi:hypothetical protein